MSGIHDLALFIAAGFLLNVTPGPDMTYIAARSVVGGFRDGAAATFGITAGCVVHTIAAAAGLSALLATSAMAFEIVKWCGAAYLLYAGIRLIAGSIRKRNGPPRSHKNELAAPRGGAIRALRRLFGANESHEHQRIIAPAPPSKILREAFIINVFNPKVALFFLAFLPQFIDANAPAKTLAFLFLGCLFNFNSLFV